MRKITPIVTETSIAGFADDYAFLSNFYPSRILYEAIEYPTVEHAFQAAKSLVNEKRRSIAALKTPGQAKAAGRTLKLRSDWETVKHAIMEEILEIKFRDPFLRAQLIATAPLDLIEYNTWRDRHWGCTMDERTGNLKGENHLGRLLVSVRDRISQP